MRRITDVRLPQRPGNHDPAGLSWLSLDDRNLIIAAGPMPAGGAMAGESWHGDRLSRRGIDLQINGGLGLAFTELTQQDLPKLLELLELLWRDGVEAIAPTLVTCAVTPLRQSLSVLRQARDLHQAGSCQLLGAHLEGPFLAEARRGAHPLEHIAAPSIAALKARIAGFETDISLITLAPEQPGAQELISELKGLGIHVALGHSTADADQAALAFSQGVEMITHAFNAMPGLPDRHLRCCDPEPHGCRAL